MHFTTNGYRTLFKDHPDRSKAACSFNVDFPPKFEFWMLFLCLSTTTCDCSCNADLPILPHSAESSLKISKSFHALMNQFKNLLDYGNLFPITFNLGPNSRYLSDWYKISLIARWKCWQLCAWSMHGLQGLYTTFLLSYHGGSRPA